MPPKSAKSVLSKLGDKARKTFEESKKKEVNYGNMELPEGLENAIARLVECKFGLVDKGDNKGKPFYYAAGIVEEPEEFVDEKGNKHRVAGQRTSVTITIADSKNATEDQAIEKVTNEFGKLGVDMTNVSLDDLETIAEGLAATKNDPNNRIYFKFRTWKGAPSKEFPKPRVNHQWNGIVKDYQPEDTSSQRTEDNSGSDSNSTIEEVESTPKKKEEAPTPKAKVPAPSANGFKELDELAKKAVKDKTAQAKLEKYALDRGITPEAIEGATTWQQLVEMIKSYRPDAEGEATEGEESSSEESEETVEETQEEAEDNTPKVGRVYKFKPLDPKDATKKKRLDKAIDCNCEAVDAEKQTVTLKGIDKGTIYKGIKWTLLEDV